MTFNTNMLASLYQRGMQDDNNRFDDYLRDPLALAMLFHSTYEQLAPDFKYETDKETRVFDVRTPNGRLMLETCNQIQIKIRDMIRKQNYKV